MNVTSALLDGEVGTRIRSLASAGQSTGRQFAGTSRFVCLCICLVAAITGARTAAAQWHGRSIDLMGTRVSVELWHEDAALADSLVDRVLDEYRRIDRDMSTYRPDSEISAVNARAAEAPVVVSVELLGLIETSLTLSRASGGAFDISYESVGYLYDFRARQRPDAAALDELLPAVDYREILLDRDRATVSFGRQGMRINLGGIAKGHAVERGAAILRAAGIEHALLNAGGDTRVLGDRRGQPWIVGIRHPRLDDAVVTRLPLVDEAISTSGDYERFFEENGRRYHHILNPRTGEPTETLLSATVIGPDATLTDGLATTVFVLGPEAGLALIERYPDYEAIVVDPAGHLGYSSGLVAPED
jgi:thiamine biosynthesis lipoprotein